MKRQYRRKVRSAIALRAERFRRGLHLYEVAREIGQPVGRVGRVEKGQYVSNGPEIRAELRKLYAGTRPRRRPNETWRGQDFPTGYQLRLAMRAHGLNVHSLADKLVNRYYGASGWYWHTYMNGDIDSETGRPKKLSPGLQRIAARFVQATIEELEGLRKPSDTLRVFRK